MKQHSTFKATASVAALVSALMLPVAAVAEQVTLKSADGTVNVVGEFVDFKDDNYIIRTVLGDLRISASRVRCEGAACPQITTAAADVMISGSDVIALALKNLRPPEGQSPSEANVRRAYKTLFD